MATWRNRNWRSNLLGVFCIIGAIAYVIFCSENHALAQIIPDETLDDNSSKITPNVNIKGLPADRINGGTIRGANLFHSFQEFNVGELQRVYFANPTGISNILTRVTGSNISNILGTLGVDGSANLFLINPNGILFGNNARLDVAGSFVASTANSFVFGNGLELSATNPQTPSPLLTVNPSALLFNQITAAPIQNNSVALAGFNKSGFDAFGLRVADGQSLLLVGGNISMDGGRLNAFGGRVELAGLASAGTVGLNVDGNNLSLSFPQGVQRADVSLINRAQINVRTDNGGSIAINARNLELSERSSLRAGIGLGLGSTDSKAGNIEVNATGAVNLRDGSLISNAMIGATGKGGDINITAGSFALTNAATVLTSTFGRGDAGNVTLQAQDGVAFINGSYIGTSGLGQGNAGNVTISTEGAIVLDALDSPGPNITGVFSNVESNVESEIVGNAGNIYIKAASVSLANGANIYNQNSGKLGNAGNVIIQARGSVSFDGVSIDKSSTSGVFSFLGSDTVGRGGNISITTETLSLTNGAQVASSTYGQGDAGNITIDARNTVYFDNSTIFSRVEEKGRGQGGDIRISAKSLSLSNNAQLLASTLGQGNAGSIIIDTADTVFLDGNRTFALSTLEKTGEGRGGDIRITTRALSLSNGAQLASSSDGNGNAGNIIINAQETVSLSGDDNIAFSTLDDDGKGQGGDINITTTSLSLTNGAQLAASTFGKGNAGNVNIDAQDITFAGVGRNGLFSGAFSSVESGAVGDGGNINITTGSLSLNSGFLSASSLGEGKAGNVKVEADSIRLDQGGIVSLTTSGNGGDIVVSAKDIFLLRRESLISTTAGIAQAGGNGGNITINTPFLVAVPNENSNITANAFKGSGGKVTINATGIFGMTVLSREDLVRLLGTNDLAELDLQKLPSSITAISQTSPTLNGQVTINTPDTDPSRGLIQLPSNLVDASQQIAQGCTPRGRQNASRFIATGRGGLPQSPNEPLRGRAVITGWVDLPAQATAITDKLSTASMTKSTDPIVEAQGWIADANGNIMLVAQSPQSFFIPLPCPVVNNLLLQSGEELR
ncbi:S-layer family protein [Nostoc cf. edaphicum LEGE 07299]|uniref:S-layer family protein n=1 Tax=Nostoc cf. edaphicum LEGE 07299 TaxID=2777974 RepID=A0ABR9TT58_9NOSO|nr:S-layer family protein [Nostoc edaphicum]MBE9103576.1 S-layer family protein [Nostoc cf. edaphicum LEGE 07299]